MLTFLIGASIGFGLGYYVGGHPEQVKARVVAFVDWIRAKVSRPKV